MVLLLENVLSINGAFKICAPQIQPPILYYYTHIRLTGSISTNHLKTQTHLQTPNRKTNKNNNLWSKFVHSLSRYPLISIYVYFCCGTDADGELTNPDSPRSYPLSFGLPKVV